VSRQQFEAVFPRLVDDIKEHCVKYKLPDQALQWFEKVHRHLTFQPRRAARNFFINISDIVRLVSQLQHPWWQVQPRHLRH